MKKNYLIAMLAAGILGSIFLLSSFRERGMQQSFKVTRSISGKELENAFWKAGSEQIPLYIYMVKKSPDNGKEDMDLMLLSRSPDKRTIPFGKALQEAEFKQQCGWYVSYLKAKGVQKNDVTLIYHLMLRQGQVKDESLEIGVYPLRPQDNYFRWIRESGIVTEDKAGKGGYMSLDSVGKCPPACIGLAPYAGPVTVELKHGFTAHPQ
jgi:hypothetical protein